MRVGVIPVARSTFDVDAASEVVGRATAVLAARGDHLVGPGTPAIDDDARRIAAEMARDDGLDALVVLQGTFTNSTAATTLADAGVPIVVWSFPEPRPAAPDTASSDRLQVLRLNSLCGATLASYALHRVRADVRCIHGDPDDPATRSRLDRALDVGVSGERPDPVRAPRPDPSVRVDAVAGALRGVRIGRLGGPPDGFGPCEYDADQLERRLGVLVDELPLDELFDAATATPVEIARRITDDEAAVTPGYRDVVAADPRGVDRSVRLLAGMRALIERHGWTAVCTRCWPECMADHGGAVCWPSSRLGDARIPAGCEADVLGTVTGVVLQRLADSPVFLADLVDVDVDRDRATLWHCGVAPTTLARPDAPARLSRHPNRGTPLTVDASLAPGRVTLARLTERPELALVIGTGVIVDEVAPLRGTTAVVRLDRPAAAVLDRLLGDGLDHHLSLVHGDVADELEALAARWEIGVIDLWASGTPAGHPSDDERGASAP